MKTTNHTVRRLFTDPKTRAYDRLNWLERDSIIINPVSGKPFFEQKGVEFPEHWSQNAVNIVAQKYFTETRGNAEREYSLKQLVDRVVETITRQGVQESYFDSEAEAEDFMEELKYILATQRAAFNSPVWFNIGALDRTQQASACFILGVEDTMPSILNWYQEEGMIFKGGSGSGINLSGIRSSVEPLGKSSATASGPLSFMRGADSSAGAIKSGGKTRRAAKMVILNVDHPDIEEFIWSKEIEERKAQALQIAGFDMTLDGKDIFSVQYQNANNSVRVTDEFMQAVIDDKDWHLKSVTTGKVVKTLKARDLMRQTSEAAWRCGDPALQYDTTINNWHTSPVAGRINGSNPCSEYMHLDNSACNLASINLLKYLRDDDSFDINAFKHTVELIFTAQEILVGYSSYPTESITKNAKAYRELGLGYANLGALLMAQGMPYDSNEGRAQAAAITALMTGHAYATSAKIARKVGPFSGYHKDQVGMIKVLRQHRDALKQIDASLVSEELLSSAANAWDEAVELAELYGVRNSQASLLAPTGTIGLVMDCDTTGIEPAFSLLKLKKLDDDDTISVVSQSVPRALKILGYNEDQIKAIVDYIDVEKTILDAPELKKDHEAVFACSMGDNAIHYFGHIKMMSAVQPFISGAISKTVNIPEDVSVEEVEQLYIDAWKLGLKAVAIYRNNSKVAQPLTLSKKEATEEKSNLTDEINGQYIVKGAVRRELPKARSAKTFEFSVAGSKGFITVGEFEDGTPGEVFMKIAKQGSTLAGVMDSLAISISYGLQYGVPLKSYVHALTNTTFAPAGMTDDPEIRTATSLVDYIFKRLAKNYLLFDDLLELGLASLDDMPEQQTNMLQEEFAPKPESKPRALVSEEKPEVNLIENSSKILIQPKAKTIRNDDTAPMCYNCGNQTQRTGSCYVCTACGSTTGCS